MPVCLSFQLTRKQLLFSCSKDKKDLYIIYVKYRVQLNDIMHMLYAKKQN